MLRVTRQLLPLLCAFLVLAWGTCPCLYTHLLIDGEEDGAPACCCDQAETASAIDSEPTRETPRSGSDDCPCCSSVGCMHEFPPVGERVELADVGPQTFLALPTETVAVDGSARPSAPWLPGAAPPPEQRLRSVILLL